MVTRTKTRKPTGPGRQRVLLQTGGEGAVYAQGGVALKIYHHPHAQRSQKLRAFVRQGLQQKLPPNVLGPRRLIVDAQGQVSGFEMPLLPHTAQPWKKLSQPAFCRRYDLTLARELELLSAVHEDLQRIHAAGLVAGDLNDHNLYTDLASGGIFWIDVDSFQFERFPCPVALLAFLDPHLYGAGDFAARPLFSPESDWYAFGVLVCKTLLKVHPYGGAHHGAKTLQARAKAGISVFHPAVTYPTGARPPAALDEQTLSYLKQLFEHNHRGVFPLELLARLRHNLARCPQCWQQFAASRPRCPHCRRSNAAAVKPASVHGSLRVRTLLQVRGAIVQTFVRPSGRMVAIVRQGRERGHAQYRLVRLGLGGVLHEAPLFQGLPGARFGLFRDTLVVNPPGARALILLDIAARDVKALTTVHSERFGGEAVFAATPQALYRLAQGAILRGEVHRGALLEEVVATAQRHKTQLWASPSGDLVAGYHHLFAEHHFFLVDDGGAQMTWRPQTTPAATPRRVSGVDVAWGPAALAFVWQETGAGQLQQHWQVVNLRGETQHCALADAAAAPFDRPEGKVLKGTTLLHPTDGGVLKTQVANHALLKDLAPYTSQAATLLWHPRGLLIQEAGRLVLAEAT